MNRKILPLQSIYSCLSGRASVSASSVFEEGTSKAFVSKEKNLKNGSVTVEAAIAVPIFFLAVVSILYLMEITAIRTSMRAGLQYAGKKAAKEAYAMSVVMPARLERDVVHAVGAERLDRSIVSGGSSGVHCSGSRLSSQTGIGDLVVSYQVHLPIPVFGVPPLEYEEKMRIKAWTGYERPGFDAENDETVYVTETGLVYHRDYHCTYLDLSIRMVTSADVGDLRNSSGGKYYRCEQCGRKSGDGVYITDTGERYHSSLSCGGLKRTVYAVPLSEAVGKGACSRCGR